MTVSKELAVQWTLGFEAALFAPKWATGGRRFRQQQLFLKALQLGLLGILVYDRLMHGKRSLSKSCLFKNDLGACMRRSRTP